MGEEIDNAVLSYFNNESDDAIDSADELLDMISCSSDSKNENKNPGNKLIGVDDDIDEDTKAQIAALQAQIELLKSSKMSPPGVKKCKDHDINKVHDDIPCCKHGKSIALCFFCSKTTQPVAPVVKISETTKKTEGVRKTEAARKTEAKKTEVPKPKTKQQDGNDVDIFSVLPTIVGESSCEMSKKRRLAHDVSMKKENEKPCKKAKVDQVGIREKSSGKAPVPEKGNSHVFSGIDVSKPIMSSTVFDERTNGRKVVKISKIETTIKGHDIEGDWVTVGVVVKRVTQKKSSTGKNFCVWHLSDLCLGTENNVIGLFLFGDSYKQHWKIQVGRVIALLNPNLMKQDEKYSNQQISISIDNPKKLMELGDSKELGGCKGNRKSDGRPCNMYINKKYGEYCEYHVTAAFKKAKSGRMDLQSGGRAPKTKGNILKNLKRDISDGVYYYGGKTVTLQEERGNSAVKGKNDNSSMTGLKSVMGHQIRLQAAIQFNEMKLKKEGEAKLSQPDPSATAFLKQNRNELLNLSKKKENLAVESRVDDVKKKSPKLSQIQSMKQNKNKDNLVDKSVGDQTLKSCDLNFFDSLPVERKKVSPKLKSNPVLGRGLKTDAFLEFTPDEDDFCYDKHTGEEPLVSNENLMKVKTPKNISVEIETKKNDKTVSVRSVLAKRNAISIVQANGPIEFKDPNIDIVKKKPPKSLQDITTLTHKCEEYCGDKTKQKKKSLLAGVLGQIDLNSADGKKLLQQKSKHIGAVKLAEAEREEKYFDSLEKKENMLEKMTNIFEIKVNGIACRECQYLAESQSQLCKDLNHAVAKISNVLKRFFICKSCKQRCCSYNKLLPKKPCTRCGDSNYEKTSMSMQRKGPLLGAETLEIRGREQKFLNSYS